MNTRVCQLGLVLLSFLAVPSLSWAQGGDGSSLFVGGLGGVTFGTETSGAVAGQVGLRVGPNLFVIGEVGWIQNALPKEIRDRFDEVMAELGESGIPVRLEFTLPATYGFGGVRWIGPGAVAPYVEGGVGAGHVRLNVQRAEFSGIDFSDEIEHELGDEISKTESLFAVGGGINVALSARVTLDAGYRFMRIVTDDPAINVSMFYASVKIGARR